MCIFVLFTVSFLFRGLGMDQTVDSITFFIACTWPSLKHSPVDASRNEQNEKYNEACKILQVQLCSDRVSWTPPHTGQILYILSLSFSNFLKLKKKSCSYSFWTKLLVVKHVSIIFTLQFEKEVVYIVYILLFHESNFTFLVLLKVKTLTSFSLY